MGGSIKACRHEIKRWLLILLIYRVKAGSPKAITVGGQGAWLALQASASANCGLRPGTWHARAPAGGNQPAMGLEMASYWVPLKRVTTFFLIG